MVHHYKEFCACATEAERKEKIQFICGNDKVQILDLLEECKQDLISSDEDARSMAIQFISMCITSGRVGDKSSHAFLLNFLMQKIPELLVLPHVLKAINFLLSSTLTTNLV